MKTVELMPSQRKACSYIPAIREYNRLLHAQAKKIITEQVPEVGNEKGRYCIVTTGSDGRYEKSPLSRIELILLHQGADNIEEIKTKLKIVGIENGLFNNISETKDLRNEPSIQYSSYTDRIFPTRPLDSLILTGNDTIARRYKDKIIEDLEGKEGKRRLSKFDSQRRYHRKLLEEGRKGEEIHFDTDNGLIFYNGNRIRSTKFTHLRATQFKIAADLCKTLRNSENKEIGYEFLEEFPGPTLERLNFLLHSGVSSLSYQEIDDISSAYSNSLYWYHLSEEKYKLNSEESISVDIGEFKETTQILTRFANKKNILKF